MKRIIVIIAVNMDYDFKKGNDANVIMYDSQAVYTAYEPGKADWRYEDFFKDDISCSTYALQIYQKDFVLTIEKLEKATGAQKGAYLPPISASIHMPKEGIPLLEEFVKKFRRA